MINPLSKKLLRIKPVGAAEPLIVALEMVPRIAFGFYGNMDNLEVESFSPDDTVIWQEQLLSRKGISEPEKDPDELMTDVLGEWLQFYGPVSEGFIRRRLGISKTRLQLALEDLLDSQKLITGCLITDGSEEDVCDSENFEMLLRLSRADAVPSFEPLKIEWLPLFLAVFQGIVNTEENIDGLYNRMEQLLCYPLRAGLWESEVFPARLRPYDKAWLDRIMQETDLRWIGSEKQRVAFCFESDLYLIQGEKDGLGQTGLQAGIETQPDSRVDSGSESSPGGDANALVFPDLSGRYNFSTLLGITGLSPSELSDQIWEAVWQGQVTNDTFLSLRRGIENRFKASKSITGHGRTPGRRRPPGGRGAFSKWKVSHPFAGNWFQMAIPEISDDPMEREERNKDRVRLLMDRYGILFRELLAREAPPSSGRVCFGRCGLWNCQGRSWQDTFFMVSPAPSSSHTVPFASYRENCRTILYTGSMQPILPHYAGFNWMK